MADAREAFFVRKQKENILQQEEAIEQQYNREFFTPQAKDALYVDPKNSVRGPARNTQVARTVQKGRTNTMAEEIRPVVRATQKATTPSRRTVSQKR
jgi:hypothetical protein